MTTATAAASAEGALGPVAHGLGFVYNEAAPVEVLAVELVQRGHGFVIILEFDETETAAAAGHLVGNDGC